MYPSKFEKLEKGDVASRYATLFRDRDFIIIPFCDPKSALGASLASVRSVVALNERTGDNIDIIYVDPDHHEKYREFVEFVYLLARQEVRDNFSCNFIILCSKHGDQFMVTYCVEKFTPDQLEKFLFSLIEYLKSVAFPMSLEVEKKLYDYVLPFRGRIWFRDFVRDNKEIIFPLLYEILVGKKE